MTHAIPFEKKEGLDEKRGIIEQNQVHAHESSGMEIKELSKEMGKQEEFRVEADQIITKIKELIHEGNIRRLTIKNEEGQTLIEIPLTLGVVGAILLPVWAAIGAIAALATKCTIVVERVS